MAIDPILAEIRAIRDAIARECNYDVRLITQRARERQQASGHKTVSFVSTSYGVQPIAEQTSGGSENVIDAEFEKK